MTTLHGHRVVLLVEAAHKHRRSVLLSPLRTVEIHAVVHNQDQGHATHTHVQTRGEVGTLQELVVYLVLRGQRGFTLTDGSMVTAVIKHVVHVKHVTVLEIVFMKRVIVLGMAGGTETTTLGQVQRLDINQDVQVVMAAYGLMVGHTPPMVTGTTDN